MLKKSFLVLTGIVVFALALLGTSIRPLNAAPMAQATSTAVTTETTTTGGTAVTGTATTSGTEVSGTATTAGTEVSGTATTGTNDTTSTATTGTNDTTSTATTGTTNTTGTATTGTGNAGQPSQLPQTGGESDGTLPLASLIVLLFLGGITALTLARRSGSR